MKKFLEKNYKIIVFSSLAFMAVVSTLNAWNDSAIFDETAHIGAAYSYVSEHQMRLNPEHPPLIKDLAGIPLLFLNLKFDTSQPFWTGELPGKWDEGQWVAGRSLLYQSGNDPDQIIFWSRIPIIILSLIFGLFIFKWTRELIGITAGIIALVLYAFNPNILGHNHFVTTDLGIAAFMAFSFFYYFKFIKQPSWKNVILAGIFLGLVQLAKFSSLTVFPVIGLATLLYPWIKLGRNKKENAWKLKFVSFLEYFSKGAIVFFISIAVVWLIYFANTFRMSQEIISKQIDFNFSPAQTENIKNVYTNKTLHWLNNHRFFRPLAVYGQGIGYVFRRVSGGNGAYFMGQVSSQAFPAYFPTVFMLKEPLPFLVLIIIASLLSISETIKKIFIPAKKNISEFFSAIVAYFRINIVESFLFFFVILYSYISITGNLNIGFRHLFPILPFIYILVAKKINSFIDSGQEKNRKSYIVVISVLFIWLIAAAIGNYPYYMSYFNEIAGGPKNGYRYVTDSNADWGQDLKRLRNFLGNHPEIQKIRVDYFGGGDIKTYIGDKYLKWWDSKRPIENGWYAISTNFLQGSLYDKTKKDADSYRWIGNYKPMYQIGTSIFVYYINTPPIQ